jgi:hypothetical protein
LDTKPPDPDNFGGSQLLSELPTPYFEGYVHFTNRLSLVLFLPPVALLLYLGQSPNPRCCSQRAENIWSSPSTRNRTREHGDRQWDLPKLRCKEEQALEAHTAQELYTMSESVIMAENVPKLVKDTKPQIHIQEVQRTTNGMNAKTSTLRRVLSKVLEGKDKDKMVKEARGGHQLAVREQGQESWGTSLQW